MDLGLAGRVVLVTGASRGIGYALAESLLAERAQVAVCSRSLEEITQAARRLGPGAVGFAADVCDDASVEQLIGAIGGRFGRLDAVVNNAGRFGGGTALQITDEQLIQGADTKTVGALRVVRHALPYLRESDQARVVNISGISAQRVLAEALITAVGNSGMLTLTTYLAHELIGDGVTVNAVIPGYTLTEVWAGRAADLARAEGVTQAEAEQLILDRKRMGHSRWATAREVADVITFFLSAQAAFVSGVSLRVDGAQFDAVGY